MNKFSSGIGAFILCVLNVWPAQAQSGGSSAAAFLSIDPGVRSRAMSGAQVAMNDGADAAYWNPASLSRLTRKELDMSYLRYFEGIQFTNISFFLPTRVIGNIGFSMTALDSGEIVKTNMQGAETGSFRGQDSAVGLVWSFQFTRRFSSGFQVRYLRQTLDDFKVDAMSYDWGGIYALSDQRMNLGLSVRNIGSQIAGRPLPSSVVAGIAVQPVQRLTLSSQFEYALHSPPIGRLGLEYRLLDIFALRAGYKFAKDELNQLNCGAGFLLGQSFSVHYAFGLNSDISNSNHVSLNWRFGKTFPEKVFAQKNSRDPDQNATAYTRNQTLVITRLKSVNLPEHEASIITSLLQNVLIQSGQYSVKELEPVSQMSGQEPCEEIRCAVWIGKRMRASKVLQGTVGKLGERYVLTVRIVDVASARAEYADKIESDSLEKMGESLDTIMTNLKKLADPIP